MKKYKSLIIIISLIGFMSCAKNISNEIPEKQRITYYPIDQFKNTPEEYIDTRETYFDIYYGDEFPAGKEIDFEDLSDSEKEEFYNYTLDCESLGTLYNNQIKIIKPKGKRKLIVHKRKKIGLKDDGRDESIYFLNELDVLPTFPDCNLNNRDCFMNGVKKHFFKHFNKKSIRFTKR